MNEPNRIAQILEAHHLDWMRGRRLPAEDVFREHPDVEWTPEDQLDVIYSEVLLREQADEVVTLQSLIERFPQFVDELKVQWEIHASLRPAIDTKPAANYETHPADAVNEARFPVPPPGFELLRLLGRGGAGRVFLAQDLSLDRLAAIKILDVRTKNVTQRLEREATTLAKISHPQIVQIYSVGMMQDQCWMAMEYVPGGSLRNALRGRPLDARTAAKLMVKVCRAVGAAHSLQIVHCDLNPANILICDLPANDSTTGWLADADLRVTDFGLARILSSDVTVSSGIEGTFLYMAPEQAAGQRADLTSATDVYGLGATLYELLTARPPFAGSSPLELIDQIRNQIPVAPREMRREIPRDIETICLKCLEKEPTQRYRDGTELADELQRFLDGFPVLARPVSTIGSLARWAKRNRSLATAMLTAAVILLLGIATTSVAAVLAMNYADKASKAANLATLESQRAKDEAANARKAQQVADNEAQESNLLANNLVRIIQSADPRMNQRIVTATELTERIVSDRELMAGLSQERRFRLKLALARSLQGLSKNSVAIPLLEELMKESQTFLAEDDERRLHIQRDLAVLVASQDPQRSISLLQALVENPKFSAAQRAHVSYKLTESLFNIGDVDAAEKQLAMTLQFYGEKSEDLLGPFRAKMLECRILYSTGRAEQALPTCESLCTNLPDGLHPLVSIEPGLQLGECLEVMGRLEEAAERFKVALGKTVEIAGPNHALSLECAMKLAEVLTRLERHDEVIRLLEPMVASLTEPVKASTDGLTTQLLLRYAHWKLEPGESNLAEGLQLARQLLAQLPANHRTGLLAVLTFAKELQSKEPEQAQTLNELLSGAIGSRRFNSELTKLILDAIPSTADR